MRRPTADSDDVRLVKSRLSECSVVVVVMVDILSDIEWSIQWLTTIRAMSVRMFITPFSMKFRYVRMCRWQELTKMLYTAQSQSQYRKTVPREEVSIMPGTKRTKPESDVPHPLLVVAPLTHAHKLTQPSHAASNSTSTGMHAYASKADLAQKPKRAPQHRAASHSLQLRLERQRSTVQATVLMAWDGGFGGVN